MWKIIHLSLTIFLIGFMACARFQRQIDWDEYLAKYGNQLPEYSQEEINAFYLDKTNRYFDKYHGNQIEYTAPDGRAYLWYPGNQVIVKGQWQIKGQKLVCYRYMPGTYNPVTKMPLDVLECVPIVKSIETMVERQSGDVLGLSKRDSVPRVLEKFEEISLPLLR